MKIYIVEDNQDHLLSLVKKSEDLGYQVTGYSSRAMGALEKIEELKPEIFLIDIHLNGDNDGILLARQIRRQFGADAVIIFTTALSTEEVMTKAFGTDPDGYLVKPIKTSDLKVVIELALFRKKSPDREMEDADIPQETEYITVRTGFKLRNIAFDDIELLKTDQKNYVTLFTSDERKYTIRKSMKALLDHVLPNAFIQVHRHFIINIKFVKFISEREQQIEMVSGKEVPIGRTFKKELYDRLNLV
ncbi:MAG: response regulator transcription factor [Bacteroidota bacterium]